MVASPEPFQRLRRLRARGPVVIAHRGDSAHAPENTLAAFRAARAVGVAMQEFDVRCSRDGVLLCVHDATYDRTTDAAQRLGPGALVAETTLAAAQRLDAGSWFGPAFAGERVPDLAAALAAMLPDCTPLIEHKAGTPPAYVDLLRATGALPHCILQSFDWQFVAAARRLAPDLAVALLGPTDAVPRLDDAAFDAARALGAGMLHWHDRALSAAAIERAHAAGLLVCTYTTDDDLGLAGGWLLGVDAMCCNDPGRATSALAAVTRAGPTARRP